MLELCLRIGKYKKDNKELLTYLLFEAHDEQGYIESVKRDMDEQVESINTRNTCLAKKTLRKVLRSANKFIRYLGNKQTTVGVLMYFCTVLKDSGIPLYQSRVLTNMFDMQIKNIKHALATLHEDLQYDYQLELENLEMKRR
ncbi:hypothetical protein [Reichenbachiella sp. MALMAid0571]|uniref:hypothetical protein n=1 Tax=Reichenbachiella sp. MALMAid0571 TaxID=3143939 RepID=UPI0032DECB48